ncbi:MAG TPA: HAMP domain-containing sensor histidine kinase [Candidatus Limnocylindrales bacterium]|nr:HAMP domain-containing sensor histidine kinase [Candidatus Limnocylindrales bacterium]
MAAPDVDERGGPDQLDQLRFLHQVARLATTARTWDELLEIVVDGTRDALHADVSSLYLLDRDGAYLTLAATNGLDRYQIGRARVPFGEGVTGRVAAGREPLVIADVRSDPRFLWVRGIDQKRFIASMLSVPLRWNDQVVGVLNVQTERTRTFSRADVDQLQAIADLLAGIVEKGRQQTEAEERLEQLRQIDGARSELIALVTHELRTPLAIVRAYTELLADDPPLEGRESRDPDRRAQRAAWHDAAMTQVERLDRLVDSILASVRVVPPEAAEVVPTDVEATIAEVVESIGPIVRQHRLDVREDLGHHVLADPPRLRQILEHLIENAVKYAPPETTITIDHALVEGFLRIGVSDEGPGVPEEWRERIFEPYARRETHTARGSGIGLYAAKRLAESMGARVWVEPAQPTGARFVVALPAVAAV